MYISQSSTNFSRVITLKLAMNQGKFEAVDVNIKKWLEDKLDEKNGWCAGSIKTQLTKEMIEDICQTFPMLRTQVKLKTLLAIFHLPRSRIQEVQ